MPYKPQILSRRFYRKSVTLLKEALVELSGENWEVTTNPNLINNLKIRYGSAELVNCLDTKYNSILAIKEISNKKTFADLLLANGIFAPQFKKTEPEPKDFPVIIRKTLIGCKGKGIVLSRNLEEFNENWTEKSYWTHFENIKTEFRIHVTKTQGNVNIIRVLKKIPREGFKEREFPIRHLKNYRFSLILDPYKTIPKLCDRVERVGNILEANMFVLDVGWIQEFSDYYFIEGGTAPGLDNKSAELYAKYLINEKILV